MNTEELNIIDQAKHGDETAFNQLYNRYCKLIRYIIFDIVKDDIITQDLVSATFTKAFSKLDFIQLAPDGKGNSWHLCLMRIIPQKLTIDRGTFAKKLQEAGLGISVHFIPIFHFTYWKNLYPDFNAENFKNAEDQYQRTITIPLFPDMTEEEADYVIETISRIGKEYHA